MLSLKFLYILKFFSIFPFNTQDDQKVYMFYTDFSRHSIHKSQYANLYRVDNNRSTGYLTQGNYCKKNIIKSADDGH